MTVPVTLTVGDRTRLLGGLDLDPADMASASVVDELERTMTKAVEQAARELRIVADTRRILQLVPAIRDALLAGGLKALEHPLGPLVGTLRREQGVTRAALARGMERDPRTVRKWEDGADVRMYSHDVSRAAEALGYDQAAIWMVLDGLKDRPATSPRPVLVPSA